MKRPQRSVKRESVVTVRNGGRARSLILVIPPTCDVLMIREKGRRHALEIDILSVWSVANKLAAINGNAAFFDPPNAKDKQSRLSRPPEKQTQPSQIRNRHFARRVPAQPSSNHRTARRAKRCSPAIRSAS